MSGRVTALIGIFNPEATGRDEGYSMLASAGGLISRHLEVANSFHIWDEKEKSAPSLLIRVTDAQAQTVVADLGKLLPQRKLYIVKKPESDGLAESEREAIRKIYGAFDNTGHTFIFVSGSPREVFDSVRFSTMADPAHPLELPKPGDVKKWESGLGERGFGPGGENF